MPGIKGSQKEKKTHYWHVYLLSERIIPMGSSDIYTQWFGLPINNCILRSTVTIQNTPGVTRTISSFGSNHAFIEVTADLTMPHSQIRYHCTKVHCPKMKNYSCSVKVVFKLWSLDPGGSTDCV